MAFVKAGTKCGRGKKLVVRRTRKGKVIRYCAKR